MSCSASPYGKVDIVHRLMAVFGYRRYLEVCTPMTGFRYRDIDRARLDTSRRLMYRCPAEYDDGLPIDIRSASLEIGDGLDRLAREATFDVALVDPWHEYATSLRDIQTALALLSPGGALVVHDCLPPDEYFARTEFTGEPWCGVTYQAFLDVVIARRDLAYCTVDADFGCGVIRKVPARMQPAIDASLVDGWRRASTADPPTTFQFFQQHKRELLELASVAEFENDSSELWDRFLVDPD
jgi:hypothetical protein